MKNKCHAAHHRVAKQKNQTNIQQAVRQPTRCVVAVFQPASVCDSLLTNG
jgi:hypothetical protein